MIYKSISMTRHLPTILLIMLLLAPCPHIHAAQIITNDTVLQLVQAGLSSDIIVAKIQNSDSDFSMEIEDIISLKELGLSDDIITAMIESNGQQTLEPDLPTPPNYGDIATLIADEHFQQAYAKLAEIKQSSPTNRENDLVELEILVAEAAVFIERKDPSWKIKIRNTAVKLKRIYRTYYTDTRYWMAYARYYWMLDRESGTLKCLKKVHYYDPEHLPGLILKGDAILKSLQDSPFSDEDSEAMFRDTEMDKGRDAYKKALDSPEITELQQAEVYYKLGVYEKEIFTNSTRAKRYWRKAIDISPDSPWASLADKQIGPAKKNAS